jgi:hypothetical protein
MVVLATTVASCGIGGPSPAQTVCDGVSSEMGGCAPGRHTFTSTSCADLAREWATVVDAAVVGVLDGPKSVNGNARSVLLRLALVITTADLNQRLQALSLQADCDLEEFMAAAEPLFSEKVRAGAGNALYDGDPVATYEEWLADVRKVVRSIDEGE